MCREEFLPGKCRGQASKEKMKGSRLVLYELDASEISANKSMATYFDTVATASELHILRTILNDPSFKFLAEDAKNAIRAKYQSRIMDNFFGVS